MGFKPGDDIPDPDDIYHNDIYDNDFKNNVNENFIFAYWPFENPIINSCNEYKKSNKWIIKSDYSINSNGFEIVSPVLTLNKFLDMMPKMLKNIDLYGITDKSCGLHFSISLKNIKNMRKSINIKKLISFIDEKYIYDLFPSRINNQYAESAFQKLKDNINNICLDEHYSAINTTHLYSKNKYVEFRYIGGKDYQKKWTEIKKIVAMYIYALKLSCNNRNMDEYRKRFINILSEDV